MLTQAWGFCKIVIAMWEARKGLLEGLALGVFSSVLTQAPGPSPG